MRLRASDRKLALVVRGTGRLWVPEPGLTFAAWDVLLREDKEVHGFRYYEANAVLSKWASATAIGKRLIRFLPGYLDRPVMERVAGQTHEHRHCHEYPYRSAFRLRYVFDPRFRWAIECQGVAAELRCMRAQDARRENMITRAERLGERLALPWPKGYGCGGISNVERETLDVLMNVIEG